MTDTIDIDALSMIIKNVLEEVGLRLYDINFNQVSRTLRVFIDREREPITVKDCKKVSNLIFRELEGSDLANVSYSLEVSSPGIERPLKRREHYEWALGKLVEIDIGDKKMRGYLRQCQGDGVVIGTTSGEEFILYTSIQKAKVSEEITYGKRK
jgi:ribosome maturation factor RimP